MGVAHHNFFFQRSDNSSLVNLFHRFIVAYPPLSAVNSAPEPLYMHTPYGVKTCHAFRKGFKDA